MSKVSFEKFSAEFAKDLEITDNQYLTAPLKDIRQYDSMGKITVSLTIERLFGFQIAYEKLDNEKTLASLYNYCASQMS